MHSFARHLPVYRHLVGMMARSFLAYRTDLFFDFLSIVLQIYLLRAVWTAVYGARERVAGIPLGDLISYLTLATLVNGLMWPNLAYWIQERVREGRVAIDLAKPTPFMGQIVATQIGSTAGLLPALALAFPLAVLAGGIQPPASIGNALLYAVSLVLAYALVVVFGVLLGLIAFWTVEVNSFVVIYRFVSTFMAGGLMPLVFFPDWLRALADVLPFQAQIYLPIAIYLGQVDASRALAIQLFWLVALGAVAQLVWLRARQRVIVQGG